MLGNTPETYSQIWDLPTDTQKITGEDWIRHFGKEMNAIFRKLPGVRYCETSKQSPLPTISIAQLSPPKTIFMISEKIWCDL